MRPRSMLPRSMYQPRGPRLKTHLKKRRRHAQSTTTRPAQNPWHPLPLDDRGHHAVLPHHLLPLRMISAVTSWLPNRSLPRDRKQLERKTHGPKHLVRKRHGPKPPCGKRLPAVMTTLPLPKPAARALPVGMKVPAMKVAADKVMRTIPIVAVAVVDDAAADTTMLVRLRAGLVAR